MFNPHMNENKQDRDKISSGAWHVDFNAKIATVNYKLFVSIKRNWTVSRWKIVS